MGKEGTFEGSYRNFFYFSVIHVLSHTRGFYKLRLTSPNDPKFLYIHDNVAAIFIKINTKPTAAVNV